MSTIIDIQRRLQGQLETRRTEFAMDKQRATRLYRDYEEKKTLKALELSVVTAEAAVARTQKTLNFAEQERLKLEIQLLEKKEDIVKHQHEVQQAQVELSKRRRAVTDFLDGNKKTKLEEGHDKENSDENIISEPTKKEIAMKMEAEREDDEESSTIQEQQQEQQEEDSFMRKKLSLRSQKEEEGDESTKEKSILPHP